jgi:predicted small lipoprotein YifL
MAMLLALSACGQTGALYMPHSPPPRQHAHKSTTPAQPRTPAVGAAIGTDTSPPAPAAGVVGPSADANANDTPAINPTLPAIQQ